MNSENVNPCQKPASSAIMRRSTSRAPFREVQNETGNSPRKIKPVSKSSGPFILQNSKRELLKQICNTGTSPVLPNTNPVNNIAKSRPFGAPGLKKTLLKAKRTRLESRYNPHAVDQLNTEYLTENYIELLRIDKCYIVDRNFLSKQNPHLCSDDRFRVLHWVYYITDNIGLGETNYFKFVRLFDHILGKINIARSMLKLVAIVTCWLLIKMHEITAPTATKIYNVCANIYTIDQINAMERKLLACLGFNLIVSVPSDFYYRMESPHELLAHSMNYILDLFSFHMKFSQFSSRELATAAALLSAQYLHLTHCATIPPVFETFDNVREIVFLMDFQVRKAHSSKFKHFFQLVYDKYNNSDHLIISIKLSSIIRNTAIDQNQKYLYI